MYKYIIWHGMCSLWFAICIINVWIVWWWKCWIYYNKPKFDCVKNHNDINNTISKYFQGLFIIYCLTFTAKIREIWKCWLISTKCINVHNNWNISDWTDQTANFDVIELEIIGILIWWYKRKRLFWSVLCWWKRKYFSVKTLKLNIN